MESNSRFSHGGMPARMDRPQQDQFVMTPVVHSTLAYPRTGVASMTAAGASPLDLTYAIAHELRRANSQPGWLAWNEATPRSHHESETMPYGAFLSPTTARHQQQQQLIPQYIPRFDEGLQGPPAMQQAAARFDQDYTTPESESFASARQEFHSRSGNGLPFLHPANQAFQAARGDLGRSSSPWIERMLQSDVTPTPSPSGPSLGAPAGTSLRAGEPAVSCVMSQTVDLQSCHSNDMQQRSERSMRSAFSSDQHAYESALEFSADICTDDDDLERPPLDVKRKKRMLSNRASAQRSRQRRQERLDQLEVLTAKLRVENSTLQKKLSAAIQLAKKYEDLNKNLVNKVDRLSKELQEADVKTALVGRPSGAAVDECASSQQTTCVSSCEMVGGRVSEDPNLNDVASTPSSAGRKELAAAVGPVRTSFAAIQMGSSKKRSHDQSESAHSASVGNHMGSGSLGCMASRPRPTSPTNGFGAAAAATTTTLLEPAFRPFSHVEGGGICDPSLKDDINLDCLDSDRWFEFADCFM